MKIRFALLCSAMLFAVSSQAQNSDANLDGRVKKLEKEMIAVQRVAFPGGAGKTIQPELTPAEVKPTNTASTTAVSDLLVRVDTLESAMADLTGQVEAQAAQQKALETRIKLLETSMREQAAKAAAAAKDDAEDDTPVKTPATTPAKTPAKTPATTTAAATRTAALAKVVKPKTADAGEDAYMYGYNLWEGKFYPEAEKQLAAVAVKYPNHKRASFARNLQGRSALDDGRPEEAVKILYDNYHNYPKGERAPDSLYYLSVALTQIKETGQACKSLAELAESYPDAVKTRLSKELAAGRAAAKCK